MRTTTTIGVLVLSMLASATVADASSPRHFERGAAPGGPEYVYSLGFRVGLFEPDGESDLFRDGFEVFTGEVDDLDGASYTIDFNFAATNNIGVDVTFGSYSGDVVRGYRDASFDDFLRGVEHEATLRVSPLLVGVSFYPTGQNSVFRPYFGAGGGFYSWRYEESGEFVFFAADPVDDEIFAATFEDDGLALGYYLAAGIEINPRPHWGLFAEARWHRAEDDLNETFTESGVFDVDLSGREISLGLLWRF